MNNIIIMYTSGLKIKADNLRKHQHLIKKLLIVS